MGTRSRQTDLPQGTLDLLILSLARHGRHHGYALAQRLREVTAGAVQAPQGTLYPALHRLTERGFLQAEWDASSTGREARFYSLTPAGALQLEHARRQWRRLADSVEAVLKTV